MLRHLKIEEASCEVENIGWISNPCIPFHVQEQIQFPLEEANFNMPLFKRNFRFSSPSSSWLHTVVSWQTL